MKKTKSHIGWIIIILFVLLLFGLTLTLIGINPKRINGITVVAAENVWGNIASQIGGDKVNVTSIITDPNADPHEYESNSANARQISQANLVIENGLGYDSWVDKLVSANPSTNRIDLNIGDSFGLKNGTNPHLWYSYDYTIATAKIIAQDLIKIDPDNRQYYQSKLTDFLNSMKELKSQENSISAQYQGTKVLATESIFVYLASDLKLDLVSPEEFMQAISEGNDPPISSVITFTNLINSKSARLLVYNLQTVTPITENMKNKANANNIPSVGVSETLPKGDNYQTWMGNQISQIGNALK